MGKRSTKEVPRPVGAGAPRIAETISRAIRSLKPATIPRLRALRRTFSVQLRDASAATVIAAAEKLARMPLDGHRFVAYELVQRHRFAPRLLGQRNLERLGRGMASWDQVDCFSLYLAGPAWRMGRVPTRLIHRWARSPDRWWRRAALVCTVALNCRAHGGRGESQRTLRVCALLERDRDPMVVKAVSWALRALARRESGVVRAYIGAHRGTMPALALREVRNKLETGLKNPRKTRGAH